MLVSRIKVVPVLNYMDYGKKEAQEAITQAVGWQDYGGHHHESLYTKFFQSYLLPNKFGIDKRKLSLSARVRSGKMNREEALETIRANPYPSQPELVEYALEKLGMSQDQFAAIMAEPPKSFRDYPTYFPPDADLQAAADLGPLPGPCALDPVLQVRLLVTKRPLQ